MKIRNAALLVALTITVSTLLTAAQPVVAQYGINRLINRVQNRENQASQTAQRQTNQLSNLKKRADQLIDNRINSLNRILQRIQNDSRLSADEKSSLSADVQTEISTLTSLKAKIDADTDITTARADAKSIITNFKVYAIFEPKLRILVIIDNLTGLSAKISSLTPKLQDLINNLKLNGKDVSKLQPLLDDVNSNLSTINSKLAADKQTVLAVSASSNPSVFAPVRQDLATVRAAFAQIRHDIGQMRVEFQVVIKAGINQSTESSNSAH